MFVLVSNHFRKCFLVNAGVWLHMENIFSWPCVLVGLTWKWFEVKIFTSNHFRTHAQRERERERKISRLRLRLCTDRTDHTEITPSTSHRSHQDCTNHTEITPIAPQDHTETTPIALRLHPRIAPISLFSDLVSSSFVDTDLSLTLSSFFSQFDRIWWIFFGWVLFLCLSIEKWYYIFVWKLRKCEKNVRNK